MRAAAPLLPLLVAALTLAGCELFGPPDGEESGRIFPCPGPEGETILGADGQCRCKDRALTLSYNSLDCAACDSQDVDGRYCRCGAGALLDMSLWGDVAACRAPDVHAPCGPSAFMSSAGACTSCQQTGGPGASCGGPCGPCPLGLTCVNGTCNAIVACDLVAQSSFAPCGVPATCGFQGCYFPGSTLAAGAQCYCDAATPTCWGRFCGFVTPL